MLAGSNILPAGVVCLRAGVCHPAAACHGRGNAAAPAADPLQVCHGSQCLGYF